MFATDLAVGDRKRSVAGVAIVSSMALTTVFVALTWLSKENPELNLHQPWQDDPYDVIVSLDFVILPLLVVTAAWRVQLCRRYEPLSARRLMDLLRACGAAVGVCLATELGEWVAVGLAHRSAMWTAVTTWQVGALAVLTVATIGASLLLGHAARAVGAGAGVSAQPDWLADAVTIGYRASRTLGRSGERAQIALRWIDVQIIVRVRRHPIAAATVLACALAAPYVALKIFLEAYAPALVLLSFALPTASLFAFVVVVGRYLRIVAPRQSGAPAWLSATVVACVAGTVVFAFHDSLLGHQTAAGLNALLFGGGAAGWVVSFTVLLALQHFGFSRPRAN